jgi:hypothetical protein
VNSALCTLPVTNLSKHQKRGGEGTELCQNKKTSRKKKEKQQHRWAENEQTNRKEKYLFITMLQNMCVRGG